MRMRDLFEDDGGTIGTVAPGKSRPDAYQNKLKPTPKRPRYQPLPAPAKKPKASKSHKPATPAAPVHSA